MTGPREFTCRDCGIHVVSFDPHHANDQDICVTCMWLRDIADPKEREELRKFLRNFEGDT